MIWRKAWWECRSRVVLAGLVALSMCSVGLLALIDATQSRGAGVFWEIYASSLAGVVMPVTSLMMAGSGINSQTSWGMMHGFHPSMHFLLSLPVSRRKALFVRAATGAAFITLFVVATTFAVGFLAPLRGMAVPPAAVFGTTLYLLIGACGFYGFSTFLTTWLDEFWAGTVGLTLMGFVFGMGLGAGSKTSGPLRFIAGLSFNQTGDPGWLGIAISLAVGLLFLLAAVVVVERKEY